MKYTGTLILYCIQYLGLYSCLSNSRIPYLKTNFVKYAVLNSKLSHAMRRLSYIRLWKWLFINEAETMSLRIRHAYLRCTDT